MQLEDMAYESVGQFSKVSLRLEACEVGAKHRFVMEPACIERFIYITKGEVCFYLESDKFYAKERDMIYLPRDTAYVSKWLKDSEFTVVDMQLCGEDGSEIHFSNTSGVLFNDRNHIYDGLLAELARKSNTVGPFDWLERMYLSFRFLCLMARDTVLTEKSENVERIKPALDYLENNFTESFSVDSLANMCALSPGYFRKLFIYCKGTTPTDYRNRLRIQRAEELLRMGKYTVSEVANEVGVCDVKYFSKLFLKYTGLRPGEMKKNAIRI